MVSTTNTHDIVFFSFAPIRSLNARRVPLVGNGGLDDVLRRYFLLSTGYTHGLFNSEVLEQHAGLARAGRNFNTS